MMSTSSKCKCGDSYFICYVVVPVSILNIKEGELNWKKKKILFIHIDFRWHDTLFPSSPIYIDLLERKGKNKTEENKQISSLPKKKEK